MEWSEPLTIYKLNYTEFFLFPGFQIPRQDIAKTIGCLSGIHSILSHYVAAMFLVGLASPLASEKGSAQPKLIMMITSPCPSNWFRNKPGAVA